MTPQEASDDLSNVWAVLNHYLVINTLNFNLKVQIFGVFLKLFLYLTARNGRTV